MVSLLLPVFPLYLFMLMLVLSSSSKQLRGDDARTVPVQAVQQLEEPYRQIRNLQTAKKKESYSIAFIGDSLVEKPRADYHLFERVQALLPEYKLTFKSYAKWGMTIADIQNYLEEALPTNPDAFFLLWDSDVSNYSPEQDTEDRRRDYKNVLTDVVEKTTSTGAYLAVAGPGLLGEGMVLLQSRFWRKQGMLNDYRKMNEEICAAHGVDYVDFRSALLNALPFWHMLYKGWVTVDGEHECERGAVIISKLIADCLRDNWLSKIV